MPADSGSTCDAEAEPGDQYGQTAVVRQHLVRVVRGVVEMAYQAKRTEHSGAKRGRGAYWGPKKDAKRESSRKRRENDRNESKERYEGTGGGYAPSHE